MRPFTVNGKRRRYAKKLQQIFPYANQWKPIELFWSLYRLERLGHKLAEDECNRPMRDGEVERRSIYILSELNQLLGYSATDIPVFLNHDPRGYALKIDGAYVREHMLNIDRDWGGYGIICPEIE